MYNIVTTEKQQVMKVNYEITTIYQPCAPKPITSKRIFTELEEAMNYYATCVRSNGYDNVILKTIKK